MSDVATVVFRDSKRDNPVFGQAQILQRLVRQPILPLNRKFGNGIGPGQMKQTGVVARVQLCSAPN
jgi:hypothetical protein